MEVVTITVNIEYDREADEEEVRMQVHDALQRHLLSGGLDVSSSEAISISVLDMEELLRNA
jgi:hypothetical protein